MSKSTKFLVAGLGSIGRRHFRNLIALGERDIVLLRTRQSTLPDDELAGFPVETDLGEALEKHRPEAVVVANPTALHLEVALPAAEAGCSILLEKPVSHSLDRIDELRSALERGGGQLLVGFQFRFHPTLQKAARLIQDGRIGRPLSFHAQWGEYLPGWHPWEDFRRGYAARADLGGGVILTLTHPFDYLRMLLGEADSLWALAGALNLGLDVEDTAEIGLRMANGAMGSLHLDYNGRPPSHKWEIIGSEGTMRWDNDDGRLSVYEAATRSWVTHEAPPGFERNVMFVEEIRHFLAVVEHKEQPVCTLQDGKRALQMALAARESARTERMIRP